MVIKADNYSVNFTTRDLSAGTYFLKLNAVDIEGRAGVAQSKVNALKLTVI